MKLLDRYIGVHVVSGSLLALAVLAAFFTIISFVDDLDSVGRGEYTMYRAIEYMLLTMPARVFELFPLAAVIGSLMGLGVLAGNSELTVVRAAGVSAWRVAGSVLKAGTVLMLLAVVVGELLAPASEKLAEERRSVALTDQIALRTEHGFWVRDGSSFINIRKVLPGNRVADVYIYEFDDRGRLRVATRAERGRYRDRAWVLENLHQSMLSGSGVTSRVVERASWESPFQPDLIPVVAASPESLSAVGLYHYLDYLRDNGLDTARHELALWNKVVYPLSTGVMIFLALPLVLGRLRIAGIGARIVAGTLIAIGFHVFHQAAMHLALVFDLNPALSVLAPTMLFFGCGFAMMRRLS